MDPEIRDELERRGDSLLDEERWRRESYSMTATTLDGEPALALLLRRAIFTVDQAVLLAHAILSEAEIIQRGEAVPPPVAEAVLRSLLEEGEDE